MGWGCGLSSLSGESKLASEFGCRLETIFFFVEFHRFWGSRR